jgi:RNA polymerase sigma factor (sigma-70 family)
MTYRSTGRPGVAACAAIPRPSAALRDVPGMNEAGPTTPTHDGQLLDAALGGDRRALHALIHRLSPIVQARTARVLLRSGGARDVRRDVEDHTQDVLAQLFADGGRLLRTWRDEGGLSLENFVGLIAERRTISALRSGRRNPWREESASDELPDAGSDAPGPERDVAAREELSRLLARLQELLTPLGLLLFNLLYVEELDTAQVCARTELSPDAVYAWRSRLRRTARQAREQLKAEAAPPEHTST